MRTSYVLLCLLPLLLQFQPSSSFSFFGCIYVSYPMMLFRRLTCWNPDKPCYTAYRHNFKAALAKGCYKLPDENQKCEQKGKTYTQLFEMYILPFIKLRCPCNADGTSLIDNDVKTTQQH